MRFSELSPQAANIVAKFTLATTVEVQQGTQWYKNAAAIAERIGKMHNLSIFRVAAVIAALSPNNKWERNVQDAENMITAYSHGNMWDAFRVPCCTYTANKKKAIKILFAGSEQYEEILNGPKVIEFYHCITNSFDDVCIDGHAYSIWFGERLTMKEVPNIGKKLRERIKEDYMNATSFINEELNVSFTASEIQAITWVCHKRIYGV